MVRKIFIVVTFLSTVALPSYAAETRIKKSDVPAVVLAAVKAKYPKASLTDFVREDEAGKTVYEIKLKVGTTSTELIVSSEGKIIFEEKIISMKELPEAVRHTLSNSAYAKAKVIKIEMVTDSDKPDMPTYEIFVKHNKETHELVFAATGELTKDKSGDNDE